MADGGYDNHTEVTELNAFSKPILSTWTNCRFCENAKKVIAEKYIHKKISTKNY